MSHNELVVPPGKHPVVLTFDDASSGMPRAGESKASNVAYWVI
jgi:hypothetical protein